jgi:alpha,alpha-trehalose phosphorylase
MRDHDGRLRLAPRLPDHWTSLAFRLTWRGTRVRFELTATSLSMVVEDGETPVPVEVRGRRYVVAPGEPVVLELDCRGTRVAGAIGDRPVTGGMRADGSRITAGVPDPMPLEDGELPEPDLSDTGIPEPGYPEPSAATAPD